MMNECNVQCNSMLAFFFVQLLDDPVEVIDNALELQAFDRMEEDIRLIGYFKNLESERECAHLCVCVCV